MIEALTRYWWVPVVRGLAAIVFGVLAFAQPGIALTALVLLFGAWALVDGTFSLVGAIAGRDSNKDWGFFLISGLLGIVVGILTFRSPGITTLALIFYIAAWALVRGGIEIGLAIKLRHEIKNEWLLVIAGLASILFAVLLLWNPLPGAVALLWLIASYAIFFGVIAIMFGFRIRGHRRIIPALA